MQCKDIPTIPILEFLTEHGGIGCNWGWADDRDVRHAIPDGFNISPKLVLAKMRQLMHKGLVDGCGCGCRGDFEITDKGRELLKQKKENQTMTRPTTAKDIQVTLDDIEVLEKAAENKSYEVKVAYQEEIISQLLGLVIEYQQVLISKEPPL